MNFTRTIYHVSCACHCFYTKTLCGRDLHIFFAEVEQYHDESDDEEANTHSSHDAFTLSWRCSKNNIFSKSNIFTWQPEPFQLFDRKKLKYIYHIFE